MNTAVMVLLGLLLGCGDTFAQAATSGEPANPSALLGDWSGAIRNGRDRKTFALTFTQQAGQPPRLYFTLPEGNLFKLGPAPLTWRSNQYEGTVAYFHFAVRLDATQQRLQGEMSFDGHRLPFELARGKVPDATAVKQGGRLAQPAWTFKTGSRSSDLLAFEAATGRIQWRKFYWTSWVDSGARIRGGALYIGSSDYMKLFSLDAATGAELWRFDTQGETWADPLVTEQLVYVGTVGYAGTPRVGGFVAVNRRSGRPVWRFAMPGSSTTDSGVACSAALGAGHVFFGGLDGDVYAFAAAG